MRKGIKKVFCVTRIGLKSAARLMRNFAPEWSKRRWGKATKSAPCGDAASELRHAGGTGGVSSKGHVSKGMSWHSERAHVGTTERACFVGETAAGNDINGMGKTQIWGAWRWFSGGVTRGVVMMPPRSTAGRPGGVSRRRANRWLKSRRSPDIHYGKTSSIAPQSHDC